MSISPVARVVPSGIHLEDGFSTTIAFAANPSILFWEKSIKPPGLDGGEPVEQTTMFNSILRTFSPRKLKTMTACSCNAAYDPGVYDQLQTIINVKTTITITYPDLSTLTFYGFLQKADPNELKEGQQPELSITIMPTNAHPTTGVETLPTLVSVAGT